MPVAVERGAKGYRRRGGLVTEVPGPSRLRSPVFPGAAAGDGERDWMGEG